MTRGRKHTQRRVEQSRLRVVLGAVKLPDNFFVECCGYCCAQCGAVQFGSDQCS